MGLLDKLIDGIKDEIVKRLDIEPDAAPETGVQQPTVQQPPIAQTDSTPPEQQVYDTGDRYFAAIITDDCFPEYTIERSVHPTVLDASAHPRCYPISYLFKKDGAPVLAVLVMNRNQYRAMIAMGTYQVLDDCGIRYIRFYKGMENDPSYVLNRIRENLI